MPSKKKLTTQTATPTSSSQPTTTPPLPTDTEWHDHLRQKARAAVRVVIEEAMLAEITAFLGATSFQRGSFRTGRRNGYYQRDLKTANGTIPDLQVPRDREGEFHTGVFERYQRYEPQVADGLTEMFVAGVSTHQVQAVAEKLIGETPSAATVSRLNRSLSVQFEAWRTQPLAAHWPILYLDGVYYPIRHGEQCDQMVLLAALGVDTDGQKQLLGLQLSAAESETSWRLLLSDLQTRGASQLDIVVTDGNDGLLAALRQVYPQVPHQLCVVHKERNVLSYVPKRERGSVGVELRAIWQAPSREKAQVEAATFVAKYKATYPEAVRSLQNDLAATLVFYGLPTTWWRYIRTTNAIESTFSNIRQRTDDIESFTTEESVMALVWAAASRIKYQKLSL